MLKPLFATIRILFAIRDYSLFAWDDTEIGNHFKLSDRASILQQENKTIRTGRNDTEQWETKRNERRHKTTEDNSQESR